MSFIFRIFWLLFLVASSLQSFSQNYFLKTYGLKEGLSNNQLHQIIQAKDNTLWMTSLYGVIQYDGKKFKTYTTEDGLCSNQIRNIFEDSKGRMWFGAWKYGGVSIIDHGKIISPKDSILKTSGSMTAAYEDKAGNIWIFGTRNILKYHNNQFEIIYQSNNKNEYAYANSVVAVNDNELYVPMMGSGIAKIKLSPFSIETINNKTDAINNICFSAFKDKNGTVWIGAYGEIYAIVDDIITKYQLPGEFDKNRVWSIKEDQEGYLWLALYGGGIVRWDKNSEFVSINSKNGLIDNYCYDIVVDKENNKWITTDQSGLVRFSNFSFEYFTSTQGLPSRFVTGIVQNKNRELVISTENGLAFLQQDSIVKTKLIGKHINGLSYHNDELWVASKNGYGKVLNNTIQIYNKPQLYSTIKSDKSLLVGGLTQLIIDEKVKLKEIPYNIQTAVFFKDKIVFGGSYGVNILENDSVKNIASLTSLTFNSIYSSCKISTNEALFGNPSELVYLKLISDSFYVKHFSRKSLNNIRGFNALAIDNNTLWIGSDNSLSKVNWKKLIEKDTVIMETYNYNDGFIHGKTSPDAIFVDSKKNIWLGTSSGLMKFNPNKLHQNKIPPQLKLNNVELFSESFPDSLYLKENQLEFPYNKNHFTFNISAISLTNPSKIEYKYRLKGLDKNWIKTSKNNSIIYSYLPPGNYQFEFTANNGNGVWRKPPLNYSFTISPPFWDTIWFKLMGGILLISGVLGLFYFQKKRAIKKAAIQEEFTKELINAQEDERKRISKGLHDGIGQQLLIIKNAISSKQIVGVPEIVNNTIEEVRSISRNLHPFQLEKLGLTKALETMTEDVSNTTQNLFFSEEIENIDNLLSKEKEINLYRILQECVNNILKHSQATAAKLAITKLNNMIQIEIRDNGIGFDVSAGSNQLNSLGLKSIRERVRIIDGSIRFDSSIGNGTKIMITIEL